MVSAVCIKWREKEILLVPNVDPKKPLGFWGLPGGKMRDGEPVVVAVFRELAEETGQEGTVGKHHAEIIKTGSDGDYVHFFVSVKISQGKELKNCGDPGVGEPRWVPFPEIIFGKIKMFRGHIQGLIMLLEEMAKGKIQHGGKLDKHGVPILSEGQSAIAELLAELKKIFNR